MAVQRSHLPDRRSHLPAVELTYQIEATSPAVELAFKTDEASLTRLDLQLVKGNGPLARRSWPLICEYFERTPVRLKGLALCCGTRSFQLPLPRLRESRKRRRPLSRHTPRTPHKSRHRAHRAHVRPSGTPLSPAKATDHHPSALDDPLRGAGSVGGLQGLVATRWGFLSRSRS
jgi:hypothetical protein